MTVSPARGDDQLNGRHRHVLVLAYLTAIGTLLAGVAAVLTVIFR